MRSTRFTHLGQEWEAVGTGVSMSAGFGDALPEPHRWGVVFRSVSNPERGDYRGTVSEEDVRRVPGDQLRSALEAALAVAAIERSRFKWRTVKGIARETGIQPDQVEHVLETTVDADVIRSERKSATGDVLFTTRDHFVKATTEGARFGDVESI